MGQEPAGLKRPANTALCASTELSFFSLEGKERCIYECAARGP
jgi:hypothetical protein